MGDSSLNKSVEYLLYFTAYTVLLLLFGKSGIKKTRNLRDFFVAGNGLGLWPSVFTFVATWISAASMQGLTGSVFAFGISSLWYSIIPWYLGTVFLFFMIPKIRQYDLLSLPEFFRIRYNSLFLQRLGGIVIVFAFILYMTIQISGFGIVMSQLLDINYYIAIFLVFLFIIYTTFGGLFSVARTDGLNFFLIILGVVFSTSLVLDATGGLKHLLEQVSEISTIPFSVGSATAKNSMLNLFSPSVNPPLLVISGFVGWGLGLAANPQYLIRIIAAKDKKIAYQMVTYSMIFITLFYICLVGIGLGFRVLMPSIESIVSVDEVFPYIINNVLHSRLSGFILISMAAAAVSTANSQFLILASGFTYDFFGLTTKSIINQDLTITYNRIFIFFSGIIALVIAINPPSSLLTFGGYVYGLFAVVFLMPLYGGLFWKRASRKGAVAASVGGLATMCIFAVIAQLKYNDPGAIFHPAFPGIIVSFLCFILFSLFTKEDKTS